MNRAETTALLTMAGAFDRWIRVDDITVNGWMSALEDVPFVLAREAVKAHYCGPDAHKQIMPADVIKATKFAARLTLPQIEADVRTAKAYGLVPQSWPDRQPLAEDAREALADLREGKRREAIEHGVEGQISAEEFRRLDASDGREGEAA